MEIPVQKNETAGRLLEKIASTAQKLIDDLKEASLEQWLEHDPDVLLITLARLGGLLDEYEQKILHEVARWTSEFGKHPTYVVHRQVRGVLHQREGHQRKEGRSPDERGPKDEKELPGSP